MDSFSLHGLILNPIFVQKAPEGRMRIFQIRQGAGQSWIHRSPRASGLLRSACFLREQWRACLRAPGACANSGGHVCEPPALAARRQKKPDRRRCVMLVGERSTSRMDSFFFARAYSEPNICSESPCGSTGHLSNQIGRGPAETTADL